MKNATMLYKKPGAHDIHGGKYSYTIVDEDDVEDAISHGWFRTTPEASEAYDLTLLKTVNDVDAGAPPTREELETQAKKLKLEFSAKISDKKLSDLIDTTMRK